ncbi:putative ribonuclease H protein [Vitis vinifera]|uniref:Putative ribonuclease H protein n=1 Tax=Vitis vinifera TaxID=29760 RepID=A0A438GF78_VITVI|nr:putative ribonuclease H protein [Vitis vinifera]
MPAPGFKARRSPFTLFVRNCDGGFQLSVEESSFWRLFIALLGSGREGEGGQAISGLRVNLDKSELIPVGRVENVEELAEEFDKRKGGLGVKSLRTFNRALLSKWSWRFANERKALWNQVIRRKYGEERGGWSSCEAREAYGVGLWKAIRKLGHLVTPSFDFVVGEGRKVRFWKDKWCGTTPLCESFPCLFALATSKEAWVNCGEKGGKLEPLFH